jgi:hypothetical protein
MPVGGFLADDTDSDCQRKDNRGCRVIFAGVVALATGRHRHLTCGGDGIMRSWDWRYLFDGNI